MLFMRFFVLYVCDLLYVIVVVFYPWIKEKGGWHSPLHRGLASPRLHLCVFAIKLFIIKTKDICGGFIRKMEC